MKNEQLMMVTAVMMMMQLPCSWQMVKMQICTLQLFNLSVAVELSHGIEV